MNKQRGFTFVELVLVAAIVLFLASIYYLSFMGDVENASDLTSVVSQDDAVASVLTKTDATLESASVLTPEQRDAECSEFHNAAYRIVVVQEVEDEIVTTEVTVCCKGLGRSGYCTPETTRFHRDSANEGSGLES